MTSRPLEAIHCIQRLPRLMRAARRGSFLFVLKRPFSKSTNGAFVVLHEEQDDVTLAAEY